MTSTKMAALLLTAALGLAPLPAVHAQTADAPASAQQDEADDVLDLEWGMMTGWGPMMGGRGMMMGGRGGGMMMMGGPARHVEGRIAFLDAELEITEAQKPLFDTYAQALRKAAGEMQAMHDQRRSSGIPGTLPERFDWMERMLDSRLTALKTVKSAALALYGALDAQQKAAADQLIGPMGMM